MVHTLWFSIRKRSSQRAANADIRLDSDAHFSQGDATRLIYLLLKKFNLGTYRTPMSKTQDVSSTYGTVYEIRKGSMLGLLSNYCTTLPMNNTTSGDDDCDETTGAAILFLDPPADYTEIDAKCLIEDLERHFCPLSSNAESFAVLCAGVTHFSKLVRKEEASFLPNGRILRRLRENLWIVGSLWRMADNEMSETDKDAGRKACVIWTRQRFLRCSYVSASRSVVSRHQVPEPRVHVEPTLKMKKAEHLQPPSRLDEVRALLRRASRRDVSKAKRE